MQLRNAKIADETNHHANKNMYWSSKPTNCDGHCAIAVSALDCKKGATTNSRWHSLLTEESITGLVIPEAVWYVHSLPYLALSNGLQVTAIESARQAVSDGRMRPMSSDFQTRDQICLIDICWRTVLVIQLSFFPITMLQILASINRHLSVASTDLPVRP